MFRTRGDPLCAGDPGTMFRTRVDPEASNLCASDLVTLFNSWWIPKPVLSVLAIWESCSTVGDPEDSALGADDSENWLQLSGKLENQRDACAGDRGARFRVSSRLKSAIARSVVSNKYMVLDGVQLS